MLRCMAHSLLKETEQANKCMKQVLLPDENVKIACKLFPITVHCVCETSAQGADTVLFCVGPIAYGSFAFVPSILLLLDSMIMVTTKTAIGQFHVTSPVT